MSFMKKQTARIFSGLLAAAMIITSAPQSILTVDATEITPLQSVDATDVDTAGTDISKEAVIGDTDTETEPDTPTSTDPLPEDTLQEDTSTEDTLQETPSMEDDGSTVFTVTFNLCGFGDSTQKSVPAGSKLVKSDTPNPEVEGFFLEGWFKDELWTEPWDFESDTVTENLTLYAGWSKNCTVTFDLRGHGIPEGSDGKIVKKDIHSGYPLTKTDDLILSETGYHFVNWYKDEDFTQVWDFNEDVVADDMTLYAKWVKLEDGQCVVTFHLSGHGTASFQYIQSGNPIEKPEDPADIGYRFVNWYKDAEFNTVWDFTTDTVTADLTLYAKWEEFFYTVTFNLSGQGEPIMKQVQEGALITLTPDLTPNADNFAFDGWYKDVEFRNIWDFEQDTVMATTELFAKWTPTYTVTFDLDGKGSNIVKTAIREGSLIEKTPDLTPVADGYLFINWYKEPEFKNLWNFNTDTVNENITLYAKWLESESNKALVTFYLGDHDVQPIEPQYVEFGQKIKRPKDPVDKGYLFMDWYADVEYQEKWDFDNDTVEEETPSITLYAKWRQPDALHVQAPEPTLYTGKAVKPAISVYYGSEGEQTLLKFGKDYKITYKNNINSNAFVQQQAVVDKSWAEEDTLSGGSSTTGEYAVGGFNPKLPYIFIEGKGNYEGNFYLNFEIQQIPIGDENNNPASGITFKCNDQLPLGTPKKDQQTITTFKYKAALKEGTDYEASITGATATGSVISKNDPIFTKDEEGNGGGTCTLTITGKGNYTGTINQTIIVGKNDTLMKNVKISLGGKCKSKPLSSAGEDGSVTLIPSWQETVEEEKENSEGETIYDRNGNPVMVKKTYYYQYIDGDWVTPSDLDYEDENGKIIKGRLDKSNAFTVKSGNTWLKYGDDYDIEYRNNTSTGTATMIIKGMGSYIGSVSVNFKITGGGGKAFSAGTITFSSDEEGNGWLSKMPYTGAPLTQSVTLETKKRTKVYECGYENGDEEEYEYEYKYYEDGEWFTDTITKTRRHRHNRNCDYSVIIDHVFDPEEYTVTYVNNIECGTATAIFTANPESGYSGSFKKTFRIVGVDIARYVTFECDGDTLEPNVWQDEVSTGKRDEFGDIIYKTVEKISATRTMKETQPYAKAGATLNFSLYPENDADTILVPNRDYTIKYSSNKNITPYKRILLNKWKEEDDWNDDGVVTKWHWEYEYDEVPNPAKMGTLTITGKGNYTGKIIIKYQIIQGSLNMDDVIIDVAHSEYNAKTKEYKPKVTVRTERDGTFSPKDYTVEYVNNKKEQIAKWMSLETNAAAEAPYVKVTFKKSNNYDNLSADEDGNFTAPEPLLADMEFFQNKLTANNTYIVIDNEKELVYTGGQVTNVAARVYYGDANAVKAAKKANVTNNRILTKPKESGGLYGLKRLTEAEIFEDGTYLSGDYTLTYGPNNAIGKNKGSLTVNGCSGFGGSTTEIQGYGGSVTQKFNINKTPVSYQVTEPIEPED